MQRKTGISRSGPARTGATPAAKASDDGLAAWLAQTGDFAAAEQVVRDVRARYDGEKRNPFDEAECGRHYARALAAWSVFRAF